MEAVGQLAAGVAHDFNNILTVIQGHASLSMLSASVDDRTKESLEQISVAADRAAALTRQLLAFSRKQIMQLRGIGLNEAINGLLSMLNRLIGEHIKLETKFGTGLPPIHADHGSIEQVIMNLVVNARDAMGEGGKLVITTEEKIVTPEDCRANREAVAGRFICLSVTDSGCGMDESTRSRIFEPFFTTKEVGKGTGMGLATVYGIIQQHNGWIDVISELGVGSTFRVFLPTSSQAETVQDKVVTPTILPRGRETVLIVEDEENLRLLVDTILTEQGYKTMCAENGVEALKIWATKQNEIDLLLTDIVMPEAISGLQLAERMLKTHPELKVIYTSGYSIDLIAKGYALRDGQNFLPKPYPPAKLASAVRSCLDAIVPHPTSKNGQSRPLSKVTPLMKDPAPKTKGLPKQSTKRVKTSTTK
jgi:CheY-like chemotaxis protein